MPQQQIIERKHKTGLLGEMLEEVLGLTKQEMLEVWKVQLEAADKGLTLARALRAESKIPEDAAVDVGRGKTIAFGQLLDKTLLLREELDGLRDGKRDITDEEKAIEKQFSFNTNNLFNHINRHIETQGLLNENVPHPDNGADLRVEKHFMPRIGRVISEQKAFRSKSSVEAVEGLKHIELALELLPALDGDTAHAGALKLLANDNKIPSQVTAADFQARGQFAPVFDRAEPQALRPEAVKNSARALLTLLHDAEQKGILQEVSDNKTVRQALRTLPILAWETKSWLAEELAADPKMQRDSTINIKGTIRNELKQFMEMHGSSPEKQEKGFLGDLFQKVANGIGWLVNNLLVKPMQWVASKIPVIKRMVPERDTDDSMEDRADSLLTGVAIVTLKELHMKTQEGSNTASVDAATADTIMQWIGQQAERMGADMKDIVEKVDEAARDMKLISKNAEELSSLQAAVQAVQPPA